MPITPLRRRFRRRARAALALTVAFVVFAQALGAGLVQGVPRLRDPIYHARADLLRERTAGAERPFALVALGSSRTQFAFTPIEVGLENRLATALGRPAVAFNFGVQGAGPLTHDIYLRRLLATGLRPGAVYLEITPSMLLDANGELLEFRNRALAARSLSWDELARLERWGVGNGMRTEWLKTRVQGLWEYRFQFVGSVASGWVPHRYSARRQPPVDACGWMPLELDSWTEAMKRDAAPLARREHGPALSRGRVHPAPIAAVRSICETCAGEGIPLALVVMPEGPSFRALYSREVEAGFGKTVEGLRADLGVPVVDARTWIEEDDFIDGHHLLPAGAKKFTTRFAEDAVLPHAARWRVAVGN